MKLNSSKIPRINIEIPDYKFFHSPSQMEKNDSRFIGRDDIIGKLKMILTNSESKTGSYLVTGYRGMGKSSFVNKVMSEITLKRLKWHIHILIWFFFWCVMCVIFSKFDSIISYVVWGINFMFLLIELVYCYFKVRRINLVPLIKETRSTMFAYVITNSIVFFTILFVFFLPQFNISNKRALSLILTCSSIIIFYNNYYYEQVLNKYYLLEYLHLSKSNLLSYLIKKIRPLPLRISKYLKEINDRRKRVVIHLNLGQENLDEKDVTGLVARNLELEFKEFAYSFRRQWLYYIVKFSFILTLSWFLSTSKNSLHQFLIEKSDIGYILPSQLKDNSEQTTDAFKNNKLTTIYYKNISKDVILNYNFNINGDFGYIFLKNILLVIRVGDAYLDQGFAYFMWCITEERFHLNYFFFIYIFLINIVIKTLLLVYFNSKYAVNSSRRTIIRKLRFLNENIDAVIKKEQSFDADNSFGNFNFKSRLGLSREYPIAGSRQIEKNLIDVFEDIGNLAPWLLKPEFIFVFDELDKIDPKSNKDDQDALTADYDASVLGFIGGTSTRIRRQNVLRLLGGLKYLITTAKAKFVFISGRELYDAFLADVSDRQFSISSIFHEVIYVDSFLSDTSDKQNYDVISMSEHYICQILLPKWYVEYLEFTKQYQNKYEILTLCNYQHYLEDMKIQTSNVELERVGLLLSQFVNYLTHVSNGAPKKISNLVEKHIIERVKPAVEDGANDIYIGCQKEGMYLTFGYVDQCKIGFIHYLAHPILLGIMNNVSSYGDKLLISASFLIDHIFKFHNNGFSWRNIENTPEILDSSKTPELRTLINSIISYLTQTHLSVIISGLYIFKFPKKISEEIQFISKMSEDASAIFNFSLDESLSVKKHYTKLLDSYLKLYSKEKELSSNDRTDLLHTISNIHHILGDLHLLDEEYTEAIFEYQNCIQFASTDFKKYDPHNDSHILFIVRNMLKLGLTFEKRKTYNSAYVIYSELISILIDYRYLAEDELELNYKIEPLQGWRKYGSVLFNPLNKNNLPKNTFRHETLPESFVDTERHEEMVFILKGENLNSGLSEIVTPLKNKIVTRLTMFEDMRLMYQGLLAKLFVIEKQQLGGISQENLDIVEGEFLYLHLATNLKDKFLISADFFKKVGDILFYKNGLITHQSSHLFAGLYFWDYDVRYDIDRFSKSLEKKDLLNSILNIGFRDFRLYIERIIDREAEEHILDECKETFRDTFSRFIEENINQNGIAITETEREISVVFDKVKHRIGINKSSFKETLFEFIHDAKAFNPPQHKLRLISKSIDCCERRDYLLHKRNITPCYACKYFNRSLKILADNLLNLSENEYPSTKAILFLEALENDTYKFYSNRANFNQNLASTLSGLGDVMVSCSTEQDYIFPDFLSELLDYIDGDYGILSFKNNVNNRKLQTKLDHLNGLNELWFDDYLIKQVLVSEYFTNRNNINLSNIFNLFDSLFAESKNETELTEFNKISVIKIFIDSKLAKEINFKDDLKKCINESKLQYELLNTYKKGISQLEKSLLYYLAAAKYYKRSSNYREAAFMYKKMLKVLIQFIESKPQYKDWISKFVNRIGDQITRRIIQNIHSAYDHIHIAEANRFKISKTERFYDYLSLNQLSVLPELEDTIYTHYRIELACGYLVVNDEVFNKLYNMPSLTSARLNSSIYNRLISLRFKSFLNQKILEDKLIKFDFERIFDKISCQSFFTTLVDKLKKDQDIEFIEDLIIDSIFCLQKFIEVVYPHNSTTLFNNGYVANIYKNLFEWTVLFELLLKLYSCESHENLNIPITICHTCSNSDKKCCLCFNYKQFNLSDQKKVDRLWAKLHNVVDKSQIYVVNSSYLAEMAIKKYQSAFGMHKEGKSYKDAIEDMYFLNDDLDNESYKFYLALERYRINTSDTYNSMRKIKDKYSNAELFQIKNYLQPIKD